MNRAARVAAAVVVTAAVVIAARPHRPAPSPAALAAATPDPAIAAAAATFVTAVSGVDTAHPHGDLAALATVTTPGLLTEIRAAQPAVPPGARPRVHIVEVATVPGPTGVARVFVTAALATGTADASSLAVGYLLTLQRSPGGWQVTGVAS